MTSSSSINVSLKSNVDKQSTAARNSMYNRDKVEQNHLFWLMLTNHIQHDIACEQPIGIKAKEGTIDIFF